MIPLFVYPAAAIVTFIGYKMHKAAPKKVTVPDNYVAPPPSPFIGPTNEQGFSAASFTQPVQSVNSLYRAAEGDSATQIGARFNTPEGGILTLVKLNPGLKQISPDGSAHYPVKAGDSLVVPAGIDRGPRSGAKGTVY